LDDRTWEAARERFLELWKASRNDAVEEALHGLGAAPDGAKELEDHLLALEDDLQSELARLLRKFQRQTLTDRLGETLRLATSEAVKSRLLRSLIRIEWEQHLVDQDAALRLAKKAGWEGPTLSQYHVRDQARLLGDAAGSSDDLCPSTPVLRYEVSPPGEERWSRRRGGMGIVVFARDRELGREVALKTVRPEYAGDHRHVDRLIAEAGHTARLNHPGIPAVYSLGRLADGRPFFTQRWVDGQKLEAVCWELHQRYGWCANPFDRPGRAVDDDDHRDARGLLQRLAAAARILHYAHGRGFIHRDVTPSNIVLSETVGTMVVDWGLSRGPGEDDDLAEEAWGRRADGTASQPGERMGHPSYWSPEQADGRIDRHGPRTDVFGLGATLYFILTGRSPYGRAIPTSELDVLLKDLLFQGRIRGELRPSDAVSRAGASAHSNQGTSLSDLVRAVFVVDPENEEGYQEVAQQVRITLAERGHFTRPRDLDRRIDPAIEAICLKAMRRDPEDRYGTTEAFAIDLDLWLSGEPVDVFPEPPLQRLSRWTLRRRNAIVGSMGVLLLLSLTVAAAALARRDAVREEELAFKGMETIEKLINAGDAISRPEAGKESLRAAVSFYGEVLSGPVKPLRRAQTRKRIGLTLVRLNDPVAARAFREGLRDLESSTEREAHVTRAELHFHLGDYFHSRRRFSEAASEFEECIKQLDEGMTDPGAIALLSKGYGYLGDVRLHQVGRVAEAGRHYLEAHRLRRKLSSQDLGNIEWWQQLSRSWSNVSRWLADCEPPRYDDARRATGIMIAINAKLLGETPPSLPGRNFGHELLRGDDNWITGRVPEKVPSLPSVWSVHRLSVMMDQGFFYRDLGNIVLEEALRQGVEEAKLKESTRAFEKALHAFKEASARQYEAAALRGELETRIGLLECQAERRCASWPDQEKEVPPNQSRIRDLIDMLSENHYDDLFLRRMRLVSELAAGRIFYAEGKLEEARKKLDEARGLLATIRDVIELKGSVELEADLLDLDLLSARLLQKSGAAGQAGVVLHEASKRYDETSPLPDSARLARLVRSLREMMKHWKSFDMSNGP
jgi:serine/threonine protein kinase/tetratricopeptide (TPR) repeat protein